MLTINLLGPPIVTLDGRDVDIKRRKSRALLYTIAAHERPIPRERLLMLLWPDLERDSALQSLRTTLYGVRQAVGDWLITDDDTLALAPGASVDVRTFKAVLSQPGPDPAQISAALDLYRGDFLETFNLDGVPDFEDWVLTTGEHYRRLALRGLTTLAGLYEASGEYVRALDVLDRALAFDPLQEDVQRTALRLHYQAGDRAGAIRRYDRLRKLLDEEMGVPPMAETRAVYDAIVNDTLAPPIPAPQQPPRPTVRHTDLPFTGRDTELARLRALSQQIPPRLALIEGEPGIGKTRLALEFIASTGALTLTGSAHELERSLPFQPVIEMLRGLLAHPDWPDLHARLDLPPIWLAETARLVPELIPAPSRLPAAPDEARLIQGISQFLQALGRPLILFLDDLQWADASTLTLLGYLIRKTDLFYIATLRANNLAAPVATLLQTLTRTDRVERIRLERLDAHAIDTIAQHLSPAYAYPLGDWLLRSSEGNPYILAEVIREAQQHHVLHPDGQVDLNRLSSAPVVPQTVYNLIQSRLAQLSDAARRVLDVAVAAGREFEFDVVYRAAGVSETAALDALDELHSAGLIQSGSSTHYRFSHSLIMEVAYHEVGEARHRLLHRRIAETLETLYGHRDDLAGLIAWHFIEGRAPDRAGPYALRAAEAATHMAAWAEAVEFYQQALATEMEPARRFETLMALADAHFHAGHAPQSSEVYRDALRLAETSEPGAVGPICAARLALAQSLLPQARFAEAIELAQKYPPAQDAPSALRAAQAELMIGTALSLEGADLEAAAHHLRQGIAHLALAQEDDPASVDPIYLAHLDFELGSVAAQQGDLARAIDLYRASLDAAERSHHPDAAMRTILAHNNLAYHLHLLNDPPALVHAQTGLKLAQDTGMLTLQPYLYSTQGEIALAAGDLDEAELLFTQGLEIAKQAANLERAAGLTANLGLIARQRGDSVLALHHLSTALAHADALGTQHLAAQIRVWIAPLLPPNQGRAYLAEARATARSGGRQRLLDEVDQAERLISST